MAGSFRSIWTNDETVYLTIVQSNVKRKNCNQYTSPLLATFCPMAYLTFLSTKKEVVTVCVDGQSSRPLFIHGQLSVVVCIRWTEGRRVSANVCSMSRSTNLSYTVKKLRSAGKGESVKEIESRVRNVKGRCMEKTKANPIKGAGMWDEKKVCGIRCFRCV